MFVGFQGGDGGEAVHVGPCADHHCVHVRGMHDILPVGADPLDAKLLGGPLARLLAAIADGDDFDALDGLQAGNVSITRVGAGADDADADGVLSHSVLLKWDVVANLWE